MLLPLVVVPVVSLVTPAPAAAAVEAAFGAEGAPEGAGAELAA
jgi:hypothetical protein